MPVVISMHDAKSSLSQLVKRAAAGETIYIGAYGRAEAKLVAVDAPVSEPRRLGVMRDRGWVADDFDAPLPADLLVRDEGAQGDGAAGR